MKELLLKSRGNETDPVNRMKYREIAMQQVRERCLIIDQVDRWILEDIKP